MKLHFIIRTATENSETSAVISVVGDEIVIGRRNGALPLDDNHCSKQHFQLYEAPRGRIRIRDLASRNGTFVEGEKIKDIELTVGKQIAVGTTILILEKIEIEGTLNIFNEPSIQRTSFKS